MMMLVIGGSGSGKSVYAEETAVALAKEENSFHAAMKRYYLATMQVFDEEGRNRVDRHRKQRSGKGFLTIEQPVQIHRALEKMGPGERTVLLECISNLMANEMFSGGEAVSGKQAAETMIRGIEQLVEKTTHLIAVSSNVFEDGILYDETVMEYIRAMGQVNRRLSAMADHVVEVVAGIPVTIK